MHGQDVRHRVCVTGSGLELTWAHVHRAQGHRGHMMDDGLAAIIRGDLILHCINMDVGLMGAWHRWM